MSNRPVLFLLLAVTLFCLLMGHPAHAKEQDTSLITPIVVNEHSKHKLFAPTNSSSFSRRSQSSTSNRHILDQFQLEYVDKSSLTGYIGRDVVQLGPYHSSVDFGCITNSTGKWAPEISGILGLGFPMAQASYLPTPLLYSMSSLKEYQPLLDEKNPNIIPKRIFSLILGSEKGKIEFGGLDEKSYDPPLVTTDVRKTCTPIGSSNCGFTSFKIQVEKMRLADSQASKEFAFKPGYGDATLDSGTSCLLIPSSKFGGVYDRSPFAWFSVMFNMWPDVTTRKPDLYFTVQGVEFKVPFSEFIFHSDSKNISDWRECVAYDSEIPDLFLLGDVFLRNVVVMHNLTDPNHPTISLANQKPGYLDDKKSSSPSPSSSINQHTLSRHRTKGHQLAQQGEQGRFKLFSQQEASIELSNLDMLQYSMPVSIGTPRQTFQVVVDTGSSTFAVFVDEGALVAYPYWFWIVIVVFLITMCGFWVRNALRRKAAQLGNIQGEQYQPVQSFAGIPADFFDPVVPPSQLQTMEQGGTIVQPPQHQ